MSASSATATPADIEALADSLSASANALHERIMRAIRRNGEQDGTDAGGADVGGIAHADAQALFEQEVALRQQANSLYVDSARLATAGLVVPSAQLLDVATRARETIRRIDRAKDIAGIVAALLGLTAAVLTAKGKEAAAALEDLKDNLDAYKADSRKPDDGHTMGA
ncbi:hypothetical protein [Pseudoduganella chitinolytica]|uniref:Uncharacterized protein n=1 Tax=Pseudoduganella chitinolytica TaxID=34070 RepID=A0ABY8BHM9_9BURK|nr:hypothetical protein [Pseudoduganella chitinolytica]WEF35405.1 hypothetical protein PX653_11825 [Pseudoduganella chitinolytica]